MKKIFLITSLMVTMAKLICQVTPVFYNLHTNNGLSYNWINYQCVDKKGFLWVGTGNGLNVFNGKTVEKYYANEYPELGANNIMELKCDKDNRIWILNVNGQVAMMDEKRNLHRVLLRMEDRSTICSGILQTPKGSIYLYTDNGLFCYKGKSQYAKGDSIDKSELIYLPLKGYEKNRYTGGYHILAFDDDSYLKVFSEGILKINYKTNTIEAKLDIPNAHALSRWRGNELLYTDMNDWKLKIANLVTMKISYPLSDVTDQFGKKVSAIVNEAKSINDRQILMTTQNEGIYIWDTTTRMAFNYTHSVADPSTISNSSQSLITVGQNGWIFLVCNPSGVSYFYNNAFIGNQVVFNDDKGNIYDGYVSAIATKDNNTFFIGTDANLMRWQRNINKTTFADIKDETKRSVFQKKEVASVLIDRYDHIWASTLSNGIVVTDKNLKLIKHIKNDGKDDAYTLRMKEVRGITLSPSGDVWVFGGPGICKIDPVTFLIDTLDNTPLTRFRTRHNSPAVFADENNLWFASYSYGVFHYDLKNNQLDSIQEKDGLASLEVLAFNYDENKNIYIGTLEGLNIVSPDRKIRTLTQKDGLLINRVEAILFDKQNRMWVGNDIGFVCSEQGNAGLRSFDERYGLSIYGFRTGSYTSLSNGEFIAGTARGLQYFQPDSLYNKKISLGVSISKIETKNINSPITSDASFNLQTKDNQVTFYFGSVDFIPHLRTYYQYKLVDLDKEWIKVADVNSVRYNYLAPGKYVFKLRISSDNKNWQEADNEVTIIIAAPFYQTWWFKAIGTLVGLLLIWYVIKYYQKKQQRQREELETEVVINYFASQINKHNKVDAMLWDIAKNCISKLNFEDCVIYLVDEEKNALIQKAAYGPKMEKDFTIYEPIEIPLGKGIVGTVAQTGKPELIGNTEFDRRYIADDARRFSELAVPLIVENKIIGVIDSEHSQKYFFKQKHLNILNTVAVLCAAQLQRVKAEEEKQKAKIEVLENKQKVTESRLQSLRLQMNPHFLFNALNSIQQMILANEEMVATKYLSKFSKLLRAILIHSDKETISLKEEIDILKLYVELESIRFKDSFHYEISCDEEIDVDEVKIPTLLVQPFVENAIWHGLMHKEGPRKLTIRFVEENDFIKCIIEDNGIGREKAAEMKIIAGEGGKHTSKGIAVSKERLKSLKTKEGIEGTIDIIDMGNNGQDSGTRVEINFPIVN